MSIKSLLQIILFLLIVLIIGSIYFVYFHQNSFQGSINNNHELSKIENRNINENERADDEILEEINENKITNNITINQNETKNKLETKNTSDFKKMNNSQEINNLTKEIQYLTTNKDGDTFEILAEFGKTNLKNSDILDLEIVDGTITSDKRSKITITSDFAQYNYVNQNAKFYDNVVIKYDMKVINCDNVDINIEENIAIAYSNVVVEDKESIMKAQVVTIDIITKDIEINSEDKVKIFTN